MPGFKQHISVAARGIRAFLNLEVGVTRAVPESRRARVQAAEHNREQGRRQPPSEDRRAEQAPVKATRHRSVIDVTKPIRDVIAPEPAEQLRCLVKAGEEDVGSLDLPICDGFVPGYVIADAIAAEFAWQILGLYFERTLYDTLTVKREGSEVSLWRGRVRLTEALPIDERSLRQEAHDRVGWTIFLQELWGCPDWPASAFYDGNAFRGIRAAPERHRRVGDDRGQRHRARVEGGWGGDKDGFHRRRNRHRSGDHPGESSNSERPRITRRAHCC